jgi:hypothetical protein
MKSVSKPIPNSTARWVGFRLAAIAVGLSPLIICELVFCFLGVGRPTDIDDPFAPLLAELRSKYGVRPRRFGHPGTP